MALSPRPSSPEPAVSPVSAVAVKLPPFWANDPVIWFAQVEAQFLTRGITSETTKYAYVVASLQPSIAQEVRDLLITPPVASPYTTLKEELVKRTSESEQKRLQKLLTTEELGDKIPSQLLRKMEQLLGDRTLEPSILKQLFLQRLPTNVQLILASTSETDLTQMAKLADKIVEVSPTMPAPLLATASPPPLVAAVQDTSQSDIQLLQAKVDKLSAQVDLLLRRNRSRPGRNRSRSRDAQQHQRGQDRSRHASGDNTSDLCWYHWTYGDQARSCKNPCNYAREQKAPANQGNVNASE